MTTSACDPCATADALLAVLETRRPGVTLTASLVVLVLQFVVVLVAGLGASQSYCNDPNERAVGGGPDYCDG